MGSATRNVLLLVGAMVLVLGAGLAVTQRGESSAAAASQNLPRLEQSNQNNNDYDDGIRKDVAAADAAAPVPTVEEQEVEARPQVGGEQQPGDDLECRCRGPPGPQGEQGPRGYQGPMGYTGDRGERGPRGQQGIPGIQGEPGVQGERGEQGIQGERGEKGDQGEPGRPWVPLKKYFYDWPVSAVYGSISTIPITVRITVPGTVPGIARRVILLGSIVYGDSTKTSPGSTKFSGNGEQVVFKTLTASFVSSSQQFSLPIDKAMNVTIVSTCSAGPRSSILSLDIVGFEYE